MEHRGQHRILSFQDLIDQIERHPQIDTIRHAPMGAMIFVVAHCSVEKRDYGGLPLTARQYRRLQKRYGARLAFQDAHPTLTE